MSLSETSAVSILDAATFVQRLAEEIDRSKRYERPFSLLLLQAPGSADRWERLGVLHEAAAGARGVVRASDVVASFEDSALIALLLPETGPTGAPVVLSRFSMMIGDTTPAWTMKLATYPENRDVIDYFLERATRIVAAQQTAPVMGKPQLKVVGG